MPKVMILKDCAVGGEPCKAGDRKDVTEIQARDLFRMGRARLAPKSSRRETVKPEVPPIVQERED